MELRQQLLNGTHTAPMDVGAMEEQLKDSQELNLKLSFDIERSKAKILSLENQCQELKNKLELMEEYDNLHNKVFLMANRSTISEKNCVMKLQKQLDEMKIRVKDLEKLVELSEGNLKTEHLRLKQCGKEKDKLMAENVDYKRQIKELEGIVRKQRSHYHSSISFDSKDEGQKAMKSLQDQLKESQDLIKLQENKFSLAEEKYSSFISNLTMELVDVKMKNKKLKILLEQNQKLNENVVDGCVSVSELAGTDKNDIIEEIMDRIKLEKCDFFEKIEQQVIMMFETNPDVFRDLKKHQNTLSVIIDNISKVQYDPGIDDVCQYEEHSERINEKINVSNQKICDYKMNKSEEDIHEPRGKDQDNVDRDCRIKNDTVASNTWHHADACAEEIITACLLHKLKCSNCKMEKNSEKNQCDHVSNKIMGIIKKSVSDLSSIIHNDTDKSSNAENVDTVNGEESMREQDTDKIINVFARNDLEKNASWNNKCQQRVAEKDEQFNYKEDMDRIIGVVMNCFKNQI